jgi:hypothetical protein
MVLTAMTTRLAGLWAKSHWCQRFLLACSLIGAAILWVDVRAAAPRVVVGGGTEISSQILARLYVGTLNSVAVPAVLASEGRATWSERLSAVDSGAWAVSAEQAQGLLAALNPRVRPNSDVFALSGQLAGQLPEGLDMSDITPNGSIAVYRIGSLTYKHSKGLGLLADQLTAAELASLVRAVGGGADIDAATSRWLVAHNFNKTDREKLEDQL